MSTMYGSSVITDNYFEQLEEAKRELTEFCGKEMSRLDIFCGLPGTLERYNSGREELKKKYDTQVLCMIDGGVRRNTIISRGFVHELLSNAEKTWLQLQMNKKRK